MFHQVVKRIDRLDVSVLHPDDSITTMKDMELMRGKDSTFVFKYAANSVIEDMTTNMGVDG
jgi:hypothetical protein